MPNDSENMNLYTETVSPTLLDYLRRIMGDPAFDDFYLVGGTALSLQLGHRISVDIDLFTEKPYGSLDTIAIRNAIARMFSHADRIDSLESRDMIYTLYVGDSLDTEIKVDLCYEEKSIFPIHRVNGIRFASDKDIAAMKLNAIVISKRRKDFWDIHRLLDKYSLTDMIGWCISRYSYAYRDTPTLILKALGEIENVTDQTEVISLENNYWEFVVEDILQELKTLNH